MERSFRRAIEINPKDGDAKRCLGCILNDMSVLDGAELSFRRALEIKPENVDAHRDLGCILEAKGDLDSADLDFRDELSDNDGKR